MKNNIVMIFLTLICAQNVCAMDCLPAGKKAQKEKMAALQEKRFERRLVRMQQEEARKVAECKARQEAVQQQDLLSNVLPYVYRANGIAHVEHAREQLAALGLVFSDDVCLKTVLTKTLPEVFIKLDGIQFPGAAEFLQLVGEHKEFAMLLQQVAMSKEYARLDAKGDTQAAHALLEEALMLKHEWAFVAKFMSFREMDIHEENLARWHDFIEDMIAHAQVYEFWMLMKIMGLTEGRFGYEQNTTEAKRLLQEALEREEEWAVMLYFRGLQRGLHGVVQDVDAACALRDKRVAQGKGWALMDKILADFEHQPELSSHCSILHELFQNLRNERKRLASLADALQK